MSSSSQDNRSVVTATGAGVLLVAYHFPPDASSTGRLRTLGFARHLPACGWQPVVLAPSSRAYERVDRQGLADIPSELPVYRTAAFDARRHMGWRGRYWALSATPDRWISWWPSAIAKGLVLIRRHNIQAIWSTYPIGTTHLIALTLSRLTGLPWVADFRDPVVPAGTAIQKRAMSAVETRTFSRASAAVFTTPGARARYAERYPDFASGNRLHVIPNGFEADSVARLDRQTTPGTDDTVRLVHSGLLYPEGRNPGPFFKALALLMRDGRIDGERLNVTLRASGSEPVYQAIIDELGLGDIVQLASPIPYRDALKEQGEAHALLLFQGGEFNAQIPAKIFEYLRIGRPVFALVDEAGDTAALLEQTGGAEVAPIDNVHAIAGALDRFIESIRLEQAPCVDDNVLEKYTRRACAEHLAQILRSVTENRT